MGSVVIFDGECNLCANSVRFIVKRDRAARFRFAPFQSPAAASILASFGMDTGDRGSVLLVENGRLYGKSDAALRIAARLDGCWKALRALRCIPRPLRDRLYDAVARRRHAWFGRGGACPAPTEELRSRFLGD